MMRMCRLPTGGCSRRRPSETSGTAMPWLSIYKSFLYRDGLLVAFGNYRLSFPTPERRYSETSALRRASPDPDIDNARLSIDIQPNGSET